MGRFTPGQIARARQLRRDATEPERIAWEALRAHRMLGLKFRRQHPVGPFTVDFCCPSLHLIIEIDGPVHAHQHDYDRARDEWLRAHGYHVVHLLADQVGSETLKHAILPYLP